MTPWFVPTPSPYRSHRATWRQPLHLHLEPLWRELTRALSPLGGEVIDIGCGAAPYRQLFSSKVTRYIGVDRDRTDNSCIEIVSADAHSLPFESATFDVAVSFQALEHVEKPSECMREMSRVIRPGGHVVITAPGVWPLHEAPRDFWRFTRFGLAELCAEARLCDVVITPLGGLWSTVGQFANLELERTRVGRAMVPLVNLAARTADRVAHNDLTMNWLVEARKPA